MRIISLTFALALALGLSGLIAGCTSSGGLEIIDQAAGVFDSDLADANDDGIPEVGPDEDVTLSFALLNAIECDGLEGGTVASATVSYSIEAGDIDDASDDEDGSDAVCNAEGRSGTWTVPTEPGNYACVITLTVTFEDGTVQTDEIAGQLEVVADA
ncbi:MAG: hypothetical protein ABI743_10890 [bacterium]